MKIKSLEKIFIKSSVFNYRYVYLYSDLRYFLLFHSKNPFKFIDSFLDLFIKRNITLIIPTFSYTTKNIFDLKKTPSNLGFLSNYILNKKKSKRSRHPLFSFAALGKNKKIVDSIGKSAFGKNSVHSKLYKNNSCYLYFGRSMISGNTLVHHIEQNYKASYRFNKTFSTKVYEGKKYIGKQYSAFLRKDMSNFNYNFNFKKVFKKIKNKPYIFNSGNPKNFSNLTVHPYDIFYEQLSELYQHDKNIFINKI